MFWNWIYGGVTSHEVLSRELLRDCLEEQRGSQEPRAGREGGGREPSPWLLRAAHWAPHLSSVLLPNRSRSPVEGTVLSASFHQGKAILTQANAQRRLAQ